ncbi:exported hypothetical protein [Xenorhabdus beddingii]|uniref:Uncharacterized protein n=1 Tax=Xenorhabdus beddingii TaxID=40578 RepID=A0A1Y2SBC0_9GAMM|nr:hypothetical protein [Xenorhabdus beddingii]OTA15240.1 exported hypothetical protein [Xenorhabdus beddingii]
MIKKLLAVLVLISVSFFAKSAITDRPLTQQEISLVESELKVSLKDPDSAKFKHVNLIQDSESSIDIYCGQVNAKNSYGGYVGFKPFIMVLLTNDKNERKVMELPTGEESSIREKAIIKQCANHGY